MMNRSSLALAGVSVLSLIGATSTICLAQQTKKPFIVADEIGLTLFGSPDGDAPELHFSPDGKYLAVWTERGRLDLNRVEDSLRFYRSQDVENFLNRPDRSQLPSPVWVVCRSDKQGPIINGWRWLADSSGMAFLERSGDDGQRLVLADVRTKTTESLTSITEIVKDFDIRDRRHYVYTLADPAGRAHGQDESRISAIVGTGRPIFELLFPHKLEGAYRNQRLWAVVGDGRFEVKRKGAPLVLDAAFALSPDGGSLVTMLPVGEVPLSWETLYPPPYASSRFNRIHAGRQDVKQYVRINLETNTIEALTDAPTADDGGWWWGGSRPSWSGDGQEILLPGTFVKSKDNAPSRPCVAVVDLPSNTSTCVEMLKVRTDTTRENGYHTIVGAQFADGDKQQVLVNFLNPVDESLDATEYRRTTRGTWQTLGLMKGGAKAEQGALSITVKQGVDDPPMLVATNKQASRVIWDPNPQLKNFRLGQASVYKWKDKEGREWRGGLYLPSDYKTGQRYPLVIQNHGFDELKFLPSGVFPTAFAARALAAQGIIVLQAGAGSGNCHIETVDEGPCMVAGYESAAKQLISEGLVDTENIGIIGFSRTCFYVMEAITTDSFHFKAASVSDGVMVLYSDFLLQPERLGPAFSSMVGASPFGEGLQQWLKRSPSFNLDKVNTPLLINTGSGNWGVLAMWEPYAVLHYLHKPVDLMVLNTDEHVLTNPAVRVASQGGTVDWFRFWLQDYEDPDPAKAEQYARWRELKKMQRENEAKAKAANEKPAPVN